MKKVLLLLLVVFFTFASCKKDKDDIDKLNFTVKNQASLIGKSQSYIKQASPGSFNEDVSQDDLLLFDYSDDSQMGTDAFLAYKFTDNKCYFATLLSSGTFATLQYMMEFIKGELGVANTYELEYYDGLDLVEEAFSNDDNLWNFIENNNISEEDIDVIFTTQEYNNLAVGTLSFNSNGDFVTGISISKPPATKSTSAMVERMKEMAKSSRRH